MNSKNKNILIISLMVVGVAISIGTAFALSRVFTKNNSNQISKLSQQQINEYTSTVNRLNEIDILEDKLELQYKNGEISRDVFIAEMSKIDAEEKKLELIEDKYDDLYDKDLYDNDLYDDFDDFINRNIPNSNSFNNNSNSNSSNSNHNQQSNSNYEQQRQEYLNARQKEKELDLLENQLELEYKTGKINFDEYSKRKLDIEQQENQLDIILDKYDDLYDWD